MLFLKKLMLKVSDQSALGLAEAPTNQRREQFGAQVEFPQLSFSRLKEL